MTAMNGHVNRKSLTRPVGVSVRGIIFKRIMRDPINILIHGEPKSGKTTFAARRNPTALIIDTEKSSRLMRGINRHEIQSLKDIDAILARIDKGEVKTVVIDTLDELVNNHLKAETKSLGGDYTRSHNMLAMQGWGYMRERFMDIIRRFQNAGADTCTLCHSELIDKPDGSRKWSMKLPSDYAREVMAMMDAIGFIEKIREQDRFTYRLHLDKTHTFDAGVRDVYDASDDSFHSILPKYIDNPALVDVLKAYDDFFSGEPAPCHKCRKEGKLVRSECEADNGKSYCVSCLKEYEDYKTSKLKEDNKE